jgi:hypothetical protein
VAPDVAKCDTWLEQPRHDDALIQDIDEAQILQIGEIAVNLGALKLLARRVALLAVVAAALGQPPLDATEVERLAIIGQKTEGLVQVIIPRRAFGEVDFKRQHVAYHNLESWTL